MAQSKRKTVFNAGPEQLELIQAAVRSGRYRSASEFLREAIDEKLERLRREHLERQVARYCSEGRAGEGPDIIDMQAFDPADS